MKQTLLTGFLFLISIIAYAQNSPVVFAEETVTLIEEVTADNGDDFFSFIAKGKITNVSDDTVRVQWTRVFVDGPMDWDSQTCDFNSCWAPIVVSNVDATLELDEPLILAPGDTSNLDVYVNPNFTSGMGTFEMRLATVEAPDEIFAVGTYDFNLTTTTSVNEFDYNQVTVFPNPSADYIRLDYSEGVDELVIYNLVGRAVHRFEVRNGVRYNIGDLPGGIYLLSLVNYQQGIVKTLRISKYNSRP